MTKKERNNIINWADTLSDEQLEEQYYNCAYDTLGSQVDVLIESGYDNIDIIEREKYEKFLCQKVDLLGFLCEKRGIILWEK